MKSHDYFKFTSIFVLLATASILFSTSCKKEVEPHEPQKWDIVWKTPIVGPNDFGTSGFAPIMYNDMVIFYSDKTLNGFAHPVLCLDASNGSIKHVWNDLSAGLYTKKAVRSGDFIIISDPYTIECLNLTTITTQWKMNEGTNMPLYANNGFVYRFEEFDQVNGVFSKYAILRTPADNLSWDTVYVDELPELGDASSIGFANFPNGDEVMVWRASAPSFANSTSIMAYNLTSDSLIWRNDGIQDWNEDLPPIKIVDGVVYSLTQKKLVALDFMDGSTLWSHQFGGNNFFQTDIEVVGQFVLIKDVYELFYFNRNNGALVRKIQNLEHVSEKYSIFENKLYGSGGGISIIDIDKGEVLSKNITYNLTGGWHNGLVLDPLKRVFYTSDGYNAYCIKIPDL